MNQSNRPATARAGIRKVIAASSVGTMIEWYDFYIFGMLSTTISAQFFPKDNPTAGLLSTLAIFAAGFIIRPFGALVFGRLGDMIGRKYTFLLTLILMGGSTFLIGCVPSYESIGIAAPIIVLVLRLLQGLALGGEYGGAATYVAEHAPVDKRGYYTSWIQTTATLGLFLALGVILLVKSNMPDSSFVTEWGGWRYPFWISILLVGVSIYIRLKMKESPMFSKLKAEGKTSVNPLKESFRRKANFKMVLLALFGAVMGQGVVWYTGQFYAQNFLETKCNIEFEQSRTIMLWAIAFATPFFIFWGWLSDKIGRKWIMMVGMGLAIITYRPIFNTFLQDSNVESSLGLLPAYPKNEKIKAKEFFESDTYFDKMSQFQNAGHTLNIVILQQDSIADKGMVITTSQNNYSFKRGMKFKEIRIDTTFPGDSIENTFIKVGQDAKYVDKILPRHLYWKFVSLVFILILYVTMVYGPIAAFLVEMFPTKIRYTSMSLPYHIGNGVFGGLVPFIGVLLTTTYTDDPLVGLWYPIGVAALCFIIGVMYLRNKIDRNVRD